jgi:hypothetical protein
MPILPITDQEIRVAMIEFCSYAPLVLISIAARNREAILCWLKAIPPRVLKSIRFLPGRVPTEARRLTYYESQGEGYCDTKCNQISPLIVKIGSTEAVLEEEKGEGYNPLHPPISIGEIKGYVLRKQSIECTANLKADSLF